MNNTLYKAPQAIYDYRREKTIFDNQITSRGVWNVKDVAQYLKVSVGHVYNLKNKGQLPYRKRGRILRFIPTEIMDWINNGGA